MKKTFTFFMAVLVTAFIYAQQKETVAADNPGLLLGGAQTDSVDNPLTSDEIAALRKIISSSREGDAQHQSAAAPKFKITPRGRIFFDGGLFWGNPAFTPGISFTDVRIGLISQFGGCFEAKVDMGFAGGKVSFKDVYLQAQIDKNNALRFGYFIPQYGLQSAYDLAFKTTMQSPASDNVFFNPRVLAIMYDLDIDDYFFAVNPFLETAVATTPIAQLGRAGYGIMGRFLYRPFREEGRIFHVGISAGYESPRFNADTALNHKSFVLADNFPSIINQSPAIRATIPNARNMVKFSPEILAAYGPVALETQFYYNQVNRTKDFSPFRAIGALAHLRTLILGGNYEYMYFYSGIALPKPGSLECTLAYNYTDLSFTNADIRGGRLHDASVTLNYYASRFMIVRLHYAYTHVADRAGFDPQSLHSLQMRLQVMF